MKYHDKKLKPPSHHTHKTDIYVNNPSYCHIFMLAIPVTLHGANAVAIVMNLNKISKVMLVFLQLHIL